MAPWNDYDGRYFPPSRPRSVQGGIKSQSQRGAFAQKWWGLRWISTIEGFQIGGRLQRGRSYARRGQVISIDIREGCVTARVQGSTPTPYDVTIKVRQLRKQSWKKVAEKVSTQALFASKLLGGEMPNEMEELFQAAGVSLFPERYDDLSTDCSCPDWSNPCKHVAAVYYLLAEEFDRDPFLIFKMRGMDRTEFLTLLGEQASTAEDVPPPEPEPLPADADLFWKATGVTADVTGADSKLDRAALPRRLGKFPFWRGADDLFSFLDRIYMSARR